MKIIRDFKSSFVANFVYNGLSVTDSFGLMRWNCSDPASAPVLSLLPSSGSVTAGDVLTASCEGQGGNPVPALSLYLGATLLTHTNLTTATSATVVTSAEHDGLLVRCHAQNDVMDTAVEASQMLEVLCK